MTTQNRFWLAHALLIVFFLVVPISAMKLHAPDWISMVSAGISALVYMFWRLMFNCPGCGTQLLWSSRGIFVHRRILPPLACPKCGRRTDR